MCTIVSLIYRLPQRSQMKLPLLFTLFCLTMTPSVFAQVGIGTTTPDSSSLLDLSATDKGLLPPRMTASQRGMISSPAAGLLVYQTDAPSGYYYYNGSAWQILAIVSSESKVPKDFRFTQPNGNGFETSQNQWTRSGLFIYLGTSLEAAPTSVKVMTYTVNPSTWHRVRVFDVTNNLVIAVSAPTNTGSTSSPAVVDLGAISNLPVNQAVFEIQLLATDATGNTGVAGRQTIGIHSFQMYY